MIIIYDELRSELRRAFGPAPLTVDVRYRASSCSIGNDGVLQESWVRTSGSRSADGGSFVHA